MNIGTTLREYALRSSLPAVLLLTVLTVIMRLISLEGADFFYGYDGANHFFGAMNYSLQNDRPHLPGYFLHAKTVAAFGKLFGDIKTAQLFISVLVSALSISLFYIFLRPRISTVPAFLFSLALATQPMVWFFGSVSEVYSYDLFFGIATLYLGLSKRGIYLLPLLFALVGGFRQSSPILLLPLYLFLWISQWERISLQKFLISHVIGAAVLGAWLVPMLRSTGGIAGYISLYSSNSPMIPTTIFMNLAATCSLILSLLPLMGISIACVTAGILHKGGNSSEGLPPQEYRRFRVLMLLGIVPPYLFFLATIITKGYMLIFVAAFFLPFMFVGRATQIRIAVALIVAHIGFFFCMPYQEPSAATVLNHQNRKGGFFAIWKERTLSSYLFSYSCIRSLEKKSAAMNLLVGNIRAGGGREICIDPTAGGISARVLQPFNMDISLNKANLSDSAAYVEFRDMGIYYHHDFPAMLKRAVIISDRNFFSEQFGDIGEAVDSSGQFIAWRCEESAEEELSRRYVRLFGR